MFVDPLVFVPVDKWSELKLALKSDWPRSIFGLLLLENQEDLLKSGVNYGFRVYCPYGNVNNGMVALNVKNGYYEVVIQCPTDDTRKLEEALLTTNIVEWEKCREIPVMPNHVRDCVLVLYTVKNLKLDPIENLTTVDAFVLDKEAIPYDIRLGDGFSFKFLTLESLQLINDTWPYKYPGSEWYYELLIKAKLGYGLYNGRELLSWVFLKEMGAIGHLYTLEKHRRNGYGGMVLKLISNILLRDKKYTVAYCAEYNTDAANLYKKFGFRSLHKMDWCVFF